MQCSSGSRELPDVVDRQGRHMTRSAFDERTVAGQVSQMIHGGVDIHDIVARRNPCGAEAQPRRASIPPCLVEYAACLDLADS